MRPSLLLASLFCALAVLASGPTGVARAQETEGAALAASFHLDDASLPDPTRSPGDTAKDAVADDLCDSPIEDFAKTPPKALCDDLFAEAGASEASRFQYACVFVIPPSIGGSQSIANVWLQPVAEARLKATADAAVRRHVCRNPAELADVQRIMASNWVYAYRKYLLPGDKLAPTKPEAHVPDAFSAPPPVPADVALAASCAGSAGVSSQANAGDGEGASGQDDRRRRLRGFGQDGRSRGDGGGGAGAQRGERHEEAARDSHEPGGLGRHTEVSRDGAWARNGRSDDRRQGHPNDGSNEHRDGRDVGARAGAGSREVNPRQSFADYKGAGWRQRSSDLPPQNTDRRGFSSNHSFTSDGGRASPSLNAQAQDVRPNDVRPNDVRPNRPGLGMPRYPGFLPRAGHRRRRRR